MADKKTLEVRSIFAGKIRMESNLFKSGVYKKSSDRPSYNYRDWLYRVTMELEKCDADNYPRRSMLTDMEITNNLRKEFLKWYRNVK